MIDEQAFVDTNVLVYAFDRTDSNKKQTAQKLITHLGDKDLLRLSTQVVQELFVTLTRKVTQRCSSQEAIEILDHLAVWPLVQIDYSAIKAAVSVSDEARISFWDALVVVAAARSGASILYTEDLNDGQEILGVKVRNPFAERAKKPL
jgi:predicted nucleic acid-binding protein